MDVTIIVFAFIGAIASVIGILIGLKRLRKKEKLTVIVTKFYIDDKKDENGNRILGEKMAQVLLTFKNCGNQQATIAKFKFIYSAVKQTEKHPSELWTENSEFKIPKVLIPGETYPYKYEEKINFKELRDTKTVTVIDQEKRYEIVKLGMRIFVTNSKGEDFIRTYEICDIKNSPTSMSYWTSIGDFEINLFTNKYKRLRKKNKNLYFGTDPLF